MGTPLHKPTDITRTEVRTFKMCGSTNAEIADYFDINVETLVKYYKDELKTAQLKCNSEMAKSLYQKGINGDVTAMIFWLKTRARWRTEDNKQNQESNEELNKEIKALRESLDAKNRKEY